MNTIKELNAILKPAFFGEVPPDEAVKAVKATQLDLNEPPFKDTNDGRQMLHYSVQWGILELVVALIEKGIDPNTRDYTNQKTPLHYLVTKKRGVRVSPAVIEYMVHQGADINAEDVNKETPLVSLIRELQNPDLEIYNKETEKLKIDLINKLIDLGADLTGEHGAQAMYYATIAPDAVAILVKKGVSLHGQGDWIPLAYAASKRKLDMVKWLLKQGASLEGEAGKISLSAAIEGWDFPVFKLLVEAGVDIHTPFRGRTFLQRVIDEAKNTFWSLEDHVELLLKKGADPNQKGSEGEYPISTTSNNIREMLLKHGANAGNLTADEKNIALNQKLYDAIKSAKNPALAKKILLTEDVDVSIPPYKEGVLLLHYAAQYGLTEIIKILIEKGADVNATGGDGRTPLHYLANSDAISIDAANVLLQHKADVKIKNNDNKTAAQIAKENLNDYIPKSLYKTREKFIELLKTYGSTTKISSSEKLLRAVETGDLKTFRELSTEEVLQKNALELCASVCKKGDLKDERYEIAKVCISHLNDVDVTEKKTKNTLLYLCSGFDHPKIASLLIDKGANVNQGKKNQTPLMRAISCDANDTAKVLLAHGATISGTEGVGYLLEAINRKNKTNALMLIDAGVDVNGIADQQTPLQCAVEQAQTAIVKRLLEAGADPNVKTDDATYPLATAVKKGNEPIAYLLLLHGADPTLLITKKDTIQSLATKSKNPDVSGLFKLTKQELKKHKPHQKRLRFANKRLLFKEGADNWNDVVDGQVKKVFGKLTVNKIKEEAGEIEYFDVVDESGKGVYQLLLFNYGDGCLFNYEKKTIVANIIQSGFDVAKKMTASSEAELREMLDEAYKNFNGKIRQNVKFM